MNVGDTKCHVFAVAGDYIGEPIQTNMTIVKGKVVEQLVLNRGKYLYFDNGLLSGLQTTN